MSNMFSWSGLTYEVTQDTLSDIVGCYSELLRRERAKPEPDMAFIKETERAQEEIMIMYHDLYLASEAEINEILLKYAPISRDLWERLDRQDIEG